MVALRSILATNNVPIINYIDIPRNSKYVVGTKWIVPPVSRQAAPVDLEFLEFNDDSITKWVKDNINPIIFDVIPYLDDPIWYQLVAIFENDNDAVLFKMRWL